MGAKQTSTTKKSTASRPKKKGAKSTASPPVAVVVIAIIVALSAGLWKLDWLKEISSPSVNVSTKAANLDVEAVGGSELACSGCKVFLDTFHEECASNVFPNSVQREYKKRMKAIFAEKKMSSSTSHRLLAELAKSPGEEHKLYVRLCKRKGVECAKEYHYPRVKLDFATKRSLAQKAVEDTVAAAKNASKQWAKGGVAGEMKYMTFEQAMSQNGVVNMSMGPPVGEELDVLFRLLAKEHGDSLASDVAQFQTHDDSKKLDEVFCTQLCANKNATQADVGGGGAGGSKGGSKDSGSGDNDGDGDGGSEDDGSGDNDGGGDGGSDGGSEDGGDGGGDGNGAGSDDP